MDTIDRIFELVDDRYKEQKEFAAKIGVAPARVSEWRNRKSRSYAKYLPQIAQALGTTAEYLLSGSERSRPIDRDGILETYNGLSAERQRQAREYMEMLKALEGKL